MAPGQRQEEERQRPRGQGGARRGQQGGRGPGAPGRGGGGTQPQVPFINAPYNFVPLAGRVFLPPWGARVSHDVPLREGLGGALRLRLVAESPLLVGGRQGEDAEGRTVVRWPETPDGRRLIPGSSLRGAIRNVLEIAAFARMRHVDDVRPGLRDITGRRVSAAYTSVVVGKMRAGLMRRAGGSDGDQVAEIVPCRMFRIVHASLRRWLLRRGVRPDDLPVPNEDVLFTAARHRAVEAKYAFWARLAKAAGLPDERTLYIRAPGRDVADGTVVEPLDPEAPGAVPAWLVLTGQVSDRSQKGKGKKYRDFVFLPPEGYERGAGERIAVGARDWRDFLLVHTDADGKPVEQGGWKRWRERFERGEWIPVFYTERPAAEGGRRLAIGLAYMPRIACDHGTGDSLRALSPEHLDAEGPPDLCEAVFGRVGPRPELCLRGRAVFEPLLQTSGHEPEAQAPSILNSPKPTYFPSYLEQPQARPPAWRLDKNEPYVTYMGTDGRAPRLRGWKRYPARPDGMVGVQPLTEEQRGNPRVQVVLHTLPAGATFEGRLVFHNLHPAELGALVWALTWGGMPGLRHVLGAGRPFGFGQVRIEVEPERIEPNDPQAAPPDLGACLARFEETMDAFCREAFGRPWRETDQMQALLAMADPEAAPAFLAGIEPSRGTERPARLEHMRLSTRPRRNDFVEAKQEGMALAGYVRAARRGGWSPPSAAPDVPVEGVRWLDRTLEEIAREHHGRPEDLLFSRVLAERWQAIGDAALKAAALAAIRHRWGERWDAPVGKATRRARAIYGEGAP